MPKPESGKHGQDFKAPETKKVVFDSGKNVAKAETLKNKIADLKQFKVSIETARQHLSNEGVEKELKSVDREIAVLEKKLEAVPEAPDVAEHVDEALSEDEIALREGAEAYTGEIEEIKDKEKPLPSVMVDKEYLRRQIKEDKKFPWEIEKNEMKATTLGGLGKAIDKMDEDAEIDAAFDKAESGRHLRVVAIKEGSDAAEKRLNAEIAAEQEKVSPLEKFLKEEPAEVKGRRERTERRHVASPEMGKLDKNIRLTEEHVDKMEERLQDLEEKLGLSEDEYRQQKGISGWSRMKFALRRLTDPDFVQFEKLLGSLDVERTALEYDRKKHERLLEQVEDPEGAAARAKQEEGEAIEADIRRAGRRLGGGGGKGASRIGNIGGKE